MIKTTLFLLFLFIGTTFTAQNNALSTNSESTQNKFVQFIFTNLDTRQQAVDLDQFLRGQPGVMMSRCDVNSKKFFLIYYPGYNINLEQVETWMQQKNMTYKCVHEGIHGVDPVLDLKTTCDL